MLQNCSMALILTKMFMPKIFMCGGHLDSVSAPPIIKHGKQGKSILEVQKYRKLQIVKIRVVKLPIVLSSCVALDTLIAKNVSLLVQNVNNLFDGPDFWCKRLSPLLSKFINALTAAPVDKSVVSCSAVYLDC